MDNGDMVFVASRVPPKTRDRLRLIVSYDETTSAALIRELVTDYVDSWMEKHPEEARLFPFLEGEST